MENKNVQIGIIGLGYVGLPLAIEFSKLYRVVGFDIDKSRISHLNNLIDLTNEASKDEIKKALDNNLTITSNIKELTNCNFYIITVPTPIKKDKTPDLSYLHNASKIVGSILSPKDIVIYESTVYPGCTEEECVPILESTSGLIFNKDFYCGYSPERINPGDKVNTLTKIKKVTSGSDDKTADIVDNLYSSIIIAGTHKASSIKVAEASKAIENAQRDLNISFVNELAYIFDKIGIDTKEVLEAAGTKWNFMKFSPGLVGGHCISVDPYYLTYKAESLGYYPEVIHSGRRVNDNMGVFIANKVIKLIINSKVQVRDSKVLVLGVTFKENCPDIRNSKVIDIVRELNSFGVNVDVHDYMANNEEVYNTFKINLIEKFSKYNAIILAVSHDKYLKLNFEDLKVNDGSVIFDVKSVLDKSLINARL